MKKLSFISILMLLTLTSTAFAQKKAALKLDRPKYNFGTINPIKENELSKEFVFTNTGDTVLVIGKIVSSRTDITVECDNKKILPGKQGKVRIKYNPEIKSGDADFYLLVNSNAKKHTDTVRITSKVQRKISMTMINKIK